MSYSFFLVPVSAGVNLQTSHTPTIEIKTNTVEAWWGAPSLKGVWNSIVKPIGNGIGWTVGQVVKFFLWVIFEALSNLAAILADILDFFIFYSIGSDAYRSTFIEAAWGAVS